MDATTAFTVIPVTVGVCSLLHLLLEKRLKERIEFWKDRAIEAEKQSPDKLLQTLETRLEVSLAEIERLTKERDENVDLVKQKEEDFEVIRKKIVRFTEALNTASKSFQTNRNEFAHKK